MHNPAGMGNPQQNAGTEYSYESATTFVGILQTRCIRYSLCRPNTSLRRYFVVVHAFLSDIGMS